MFRLQSKLRWPKLAAMLAAGIGALLFTAASFAQPPGGMMPGGAAPGQPSAATPEMGAAWLRAPDGTMPWQIGAMFTAYWVLAAAEIAIISKPSNRLDRPKKKDDALVAD